MKFRQIFCTIILFWAAICLVEAAHARIVEDTKYSFRITVPDKWLLNTFTEGTDKIWAFASPDKNVGIRVRTFKAPVGLTIETLISVFEDNIFNGWQRFTKNPYILNGIDGVMAGYKGKFNNADVGVGCFYTIQKQNAYIVWSIIPVSLLSTRSREADSIINTFTITGDNTSGKLSKSDTQSTAKVNISKIISGDTLVGSYNLATVKNVFSTSTKNIYVVFHYKGNPYPDPFVAKWIYKNRGYEIDRATLKVPDANGGMAKTYMNRPDKGWPPGNYEVEIEHSGKKLISSHFTVK